MLIFFLDFLNLIHPCIIIAFEIKTQQRVALLDILVIQNACEFLTTVHRKPDAITLPSH